MRRLLCIVTLLGPTACGSHVTSPGESPPPVAAPTPPPATAPTPPPSAAPIPPPPPGPADDVAVVDAGGAPRTRLRFDVPDGSERTVEWRSRQEMSDHSVKTPELTWHYRVRRAGDEMILATHLVWPRADGTLRLDPRGRHRAASEDDAALLVIRSTQAQHMLPIFPASAVGVGARWSLPIEVYTGVDDNDVRGHIEWQLVELEGSVATVRGVLTAPPTEVKFKDAPMTMSVDGTVEARLDLRALIGESSMSLSLEVIVGPGVRLTSQTRQTLSLRAAEPRP